MTLSKRGAGMKRRGFIVGLGAAAAGAVVPSATRAQEAGRVYRVAALFASQKSTPHIATFFDELRVLGFVEGQNLKVEATYGLSGEMPPELMAAMVKSPPDVVFSSADRWSRAVQHALPNISIVGLSTDLIGGGVVKSLARPGGTATGISFFGPELDGKRQDILLEAVPGARRIAMLADANATAPEQLKALQDAARARGVEPSVFNIRTPADIAPTMDQIKASGAAAVNMLASPLFSGNRRLLFERSNALRLPAIYEWPEMAEEGGLLGYGARLSGIFRQAVRMVVKVLRGASPAEIPVEQPTQFELVVNLQTANAIGHEIPAGLVLRADKLIE